MNTERTASTQGRWPSWVGRVLGLSFRWVLLSVSARATDSGEGAGEEPQAFNHIRSYLLRGHAVVRKSVKIGYWGGASEKHIILFMYRAQIDILYINRHTVLSIVVKFHGGRWQ